MYDKKSGTQKRAEKRARTQYLWVSVPFMLGEKKQLIPIYPGLTAYNRDGKYVSVSGKGLGTAL